QRFVYGQHFICRNGQFERGLVEFFALEPSSSFQSLFPPCVIDQYSAHRFGGSSKELCSVLPFGSARSNQPQPDLMDQSRWLQGMIGGFTSHLATRQGAQFFVQLQDQFVLGLAAGLLQRIEEARYRGRIRYDRRIHRQNSGVKQSTLYGPFPLPPERRIHSALWVGVYYRQIGRASCRERVWV